MADKLRASQSVRSKSTIQIDLFGIYYNSFLILTLGTKTCQKIVGVFTSNSAISNCKGFLPGSDIAARTLLYMQGRQWNLSFGTPPFRGHKIWSRKNVHIIFVFVTSNEGTLFLGPETRIQAPFRGHFPWSGGCPLNRDSTL